ncbi:hypothetical protein [Streptomyces acidicola]|uniref:Uncharacterized protein n=1 Tax=Streptomyces acidicola TaxID=2596892 RepID=A0A5N8WI59_9ACTN|nr:hypothetical protein [Streptomyces acidicola]MPY47133.1 hypothetical protein [Streptomyces acidicola]MPY47272.1 hypothetical protein [Streptomyces acidicola]
MDFTRKEPDRGSQICGYQMQIGSWHNDGNRFCTERKVKGLYFCQKHHDWVLDECGEIRMAPGNAIGR